MASTQRDILKKIEALRKKKSHLERDVLVEETTCAIDDIKDDPDYKRCLDNIDYYTNLIEGCKSKMKKMEENVGVPKRIGYRRKKQAITQLDAEIERLDLQLRTEEDMQMELKRKRAVEDANRKLREAQEQEQADWDREAEKIRLRKVEEKRRQEQEDALEMARLRK